MAVRHAVEITVDIADIVFEGDIDEILDLIEDAVAAWKPAVTHTVREYNTSD